MDILISSSLQVQILSKKVDVSKVTSKLGSKDNIKYKPGSTYTSVLFSSVFLHLNTIPFHSILLLFFILGGGDVKIDSHKPNMKAKSKIGSLDNVGPGNGQTNGHKVKLKPNIIRRQTENVCGPAESLCFYRPTPLDGVFPVSSKL